MTVEASFASRESLQQSLLIGFSSISDDSLAPAPASHSQSPSTQLCRRAGMGIGTEYVLDPVPTPPRQVWGGNVFVPWAEG